MRRTPAILWNTLPKSASVYIVHAFCEGLGVTHMSTAHGYFSESLLVPERMEKFCAGGMMSQEHIPAKDYNLIVLNRSRVKRMVVHLRDPRMATLEWAHHLAALKDQGSDRLIEECHRRRVPDNYFSWSWSEQIGWNIEYHLPVCVDWIQGWLDACRKPWFATEVLFTRYEDFVADEMAFFSCALQFLEIDPANFAFAPFKPVPPEKPMLEDPKLHFRNARTDEWRDVFTQAQLHRVNDLVPAWLLDRFDWPQR